MLQIPAVREKLGNFVRKSIKILLRSPRFTSPILLILVLSLTLIVAGRGDLEKEVKTAESQSKAESKITLSETPTPIPSVSPETLEREGVYGEVTVKKVVPTSIPNPSASNSTSLSASPGLLASINTFRASNGVSPISSAGTLCDIAGKRLDELISLGLLDSHAGFGKYFQGQSEFNSMGEVLFQSSIKKPASYAVSEGWAKSKSGHRENTLDPKWNFGCGATDGYIAVFDFGKK